MLAVIRVAGDPAAVADDDSAAIVLTYPDGTRLRADMGNRDVTGFIDTLDEHGPDAVDPLEFDVTWKAA